MNGGEQQPMPLKAAKLPDGHSRLAFPVSPGYSGWSKKAAAVAPVIQAV
jgi:hypothetical protein